MGSREGLECLTDLWMMAEDSRFEIISGEAADAAPAREAVVIHRDCAPASGIMVCRIYPAIRLRGRDTDLGDQQYAGRLGKRRQPQHPLPPTPCQCQPAA